MDNDGLLCWKCRKVVPYSVCSRKRVRTIGDKKYESIERYGICDICHEELMVPGLDDENERIFDAMFRSQNDLITINEIEQILKKYNIDKRPLSHVLGLGEHTISRYLEGAMPQRKYSDLLRCVLKDHKVMREYLEKNRNCITDIAYRKVDEAINEIERMCARDSKLELFSQYIIHNGYEVTNLSLQKLLYYAKGLSWIILGRDIVEKKCEAWGYGPVFYDIYEKYKSLKSEVIPDYDLTINYEELLSKDEIRVLDYVLDCFGIYNGITLMKLTHKEKPWVETRGGVPEFVASNSVISNELIYEYFEEMNEKYNLTNLNGVENYIRALRTA